MKILIALIGLALLGACDGAENTQKIVDEKTDYTYEDYVAQKDHESSEEVEEVKEEPKEKIDFAQQLEEKYRPEFEELFKNSPYPLIDFEHKYDKNYITLQADRTRDEWVEGFISSADSRGGNCPMLASKRGGHSDAVIEQWVDNCKKQVASGAYDNTDWFFHYLGIGNEKEELDEVFEPLQQLYSLTGDKKNLEITVVDVNGDLIYSVANKDKETVYNSVKTWVSEEQLWILAHCKEFAKEYSIWSGYWEGWLGVE